MICRNTRRRTPYSLDRVPPLSPIQARSAAPSPWVIHHGDYPQFCHPEQSARLCLSDPLVLRVGRARSRRICGFLCDHADSDGPQIPRLGPRSSSRQKPAGRGSAAGLVRRKSFTTETRRTRSFGFYRVFSVISVPPWWIFIPRGGPKVHTTLPMNKSMLAPEEQRVHSRTPWLGDAGGFPCARGGAALLAQRCSRRTALPCAADETECEPVCEPWR